MSAILSVRPLGSPWETADPFLFCAYHHDDYPAGDERFAPTASLDGRELGSDFAGKDGWRMYHGTTVPGFPQHPHRGFETVTIVRRGFIDHADSLGAAARFGEGDVQWLTAGGGVVHSEMFPLLRRDAANPVELFQIWLNLPAADKLTGAHFAMLWNEQIPRVVDGGAEVSVIAGAFAGLRAPAPPPRSWAARPDTDVAIWSIRLRAGARLELPAAASGTQANRTIYFYGGREVTIDGRRFDEHRAVGVRADERVAIEAAADAELLVLQGRPIGEPVAQYGPFVMNSPAEVQQAFVDYQRTQFGGWPWPKDDPVHERDAGRFARHADGRVERAR